MNPLNMRRARGLVAALARFALGRVVDPTPTAEEREDMTEGTRNLNLSDDRYLAALERQRGRIAAGLELRAVDSNAIGDKHTECSWGLCSDEREAWPDAQDHLWPDQFEADGRVAPLYREPHQTCPLDRRERPNESHVGCFWSCRIFQTKRAHERPSREGTLRLYDVEIERVRRGKG